MNSNSSTILSESISTTTDVYQMATSSSSVVRDYSNADSKATRASMENHLLCSDSVVQKYTQQSSTLSFQEYVLPKVLPSSVTSVNQHKLVKHYFSDGKSSAAKTA